MNRNILDNTLKRIFILLVLVANINRCHFKEFPMHSTEMGCEADYSVFIIEIIFAH